MKFNAQDWTVAPVSIKTGRRLVESFHYAKGASNTATYLHGLFVSGGIVDAYALGCAWWIPPTKSAAQATYPDNWKGVLSLSRLVVSPGVPKNACTFLLARSRKLIPAERWPYLVTYADDWRGHVGTIYKADNWEYCGKTKPERTYQIKGVMTARKAGGKTRTHAEMLELGAEMVGSFAKHKYRMIRARAR